MTDLVRTDVPDVFAAQMEMARVLADSSLLPGHLRGKPSNVLLVLSGARALNVPAFWALQSLHVVDGKLGMAADLMRALVIRAGHKFRVLERTEQRAVVEIVRSDDDRPYVAEFTRQDAEMAGLFAPKKENWHKYPKAMLVARATSIAVRDHCPDVLFGVVYTPDELGAVTDSDGVPQFDNGRVVLAPTSDKITELVAQLDTVPLRDFPAAWKAIVDLGWALEKIPDSDDSLVDHAQGNLAAMAETSADQETFTAIWQAAKVTGLIDVTYADTGKPLGEELKRLAALVAQRLKADAARAAQDRIVEAEIVDEPAVKAEEIDTENAARMRADAAASWEEGTDGTGDAPA